MGVNVYKCPMLVVCYFVDFYEYRECQMFIFMGEYLMEIECLIL